MGHFFSFTRDFTITDFSHFLICLACRCLSTSKFCLSPQHWSLCDDADVGGQISLEPLTLSPPSPSVSLPPALSLLPLQLCLLSDFVHWDWSDGILQEESLNGALAFIISHL